MAWKGRKEEPVNFNQLISTLVSSGIHATNNALFQTINQLILYCQKNKNLTITNIEEINTNIKDLSDITIIAQQNIKDATFWTENDETASFASSIQVIAGTGITLDYTVANQVTVSSTGGGSTGYWAPLTDGNVDETDLIFASGECIMVNVPV
jgi:hypothetical protein